LSTQASLDFGDGTEFRAPPIGGYGIRLWRWIKLFTQAHWSQFHTSNGYFTLVDALL